MRAWRARASIARPKQLAYTQSTYAHRNGAEAR